MYGKDSIDRVNPNPSGLCMCGCGEPTKIAWRSDSARGIVKGAPFRYIKGHECIKRNRVDVMQDGTARIYLAEDIYTIVDEEALARIPDHGWHMLNDGRTQYAATTIRVPSGARTSVKLHRLIIGAEHGQIVDHINGYGLDNRRANLRIVTPAENAQNSNRPVVNRTGFKGVRYMPDAASPWLAQIKHNGEAHHLGSFKSKFEAAHAYDEAARRLHGKYACLNFPKPGERGVT